MKKSFALIIPILLSSGIAYSQATPSPSPQNQPAPQTRQRPKTGFDLLEYGVEFQTDPRLIVMMAALEAAGLDPTSAGRAPSVFRAQVRKDLADLNPDLRNRLRLFYERNKLPAPATAAEQASRYVSLALAL